ncbi:hypothetical protein ACQ1Z5_14640, partial [Enterococcus faecalis]
TSVVIMVYFLYRSQDPTVICNRQKRKEVYYVGIEEEEAPGKIEQQYHSIKAQQVKQFNYTRKEEPTKKIIPTRKTIL